MTLISAPLFPVGCLHYSLTHLDRSTLSPVVWPPGLYQETVAELCRTTVALRSLVYHPLFARLCFHCQQLIGSSLRLSGTCLLYCGGVVLWPLLFQKRPEAIAAPAPARSEPCDFVMLRKYDFPVPTKVLCAFFNLSVTELPCSLSDSSYDISPDMK